MEGHDSLETILMTSTDTTVKEVEDLTVEEAWRNEAGQDYGQQQTTSPPISSRTPKNTARMAGEYMEDFVENMMENKVVETELLEADTIDTAQAI